MRTSIAFYDATPYSLLPERSHVPALSVSFAIEAVIPVLAFRCQTNGCFSALRRGSNEPQRLIRSRGGAIRSFDRSLRTARAKRAIVYRWGANQVRRVFRTTFVPASSRIVR